MFCLVMLSDRQRGSHEAGEQTRSRHDEKSMDGADEAPKLPPGGPQNGPILASKWPKLGPQMGPDSPSGPTVAQEASLARLRAPREDPKRPPESPRRPQEEAKRGPGGPEIGPEGGPRLPRSPWKRPWKRKTPRRQKTS